MIFVDTGAWYASLVPADSNHARAVQWLAANHSPLFTTDYIIDETLTLLRVRGERKLAEPTIVLQRLLPAPPIVAFSSGY